MYFCKTFFLSTSFSSEMSSHKILSQTFSWNIRILRSYSQHFIFFVAYEWVFHNTWLERLAEDKHSCLLDPFVSYTKNEVLWIYTLGLYSQNFIFFVAYKWAQKARVLHYAWLERFAQDKYSCLLEPFKTYEENKVLRIQLLSSNSD